MEITKSCPKCGEVKFKIEALDKSIVLICGNCNSNVQKIKLKSQEFMENICAKCNYDIFKAKINKDGSKIIWKLHCVHCGHMPKRYYCDESGKRIADEDVEKYLLESYNQELKNELKAANKQNVQFENKLQVLQCEVHEKYHKINLLAYELKEKEETIDKLNKQITECRDIIDALERTMQMMNGFHG
jgi:predicted nucleic-acid-binding Zn-ribbon protein/uncharacterized coiled-coil protein SlyX